MNHWYGIEYRLRRVWERLPLGIRKQLRRALSRPGARPGLSSRGAPSGDCLFAPAPPSSSPRAGDPLRVLVEVSALDQGGLEEFVYTLCSRLDRNHVCPLVVCTEGGGMAAERCRRAGIPVAVLGRRRRRAYRHLLDAYAVDLLNTHYAELGLTLAAERRIPVVAVLHNTYVWLGPTDRRRLRRADRFVGRYVAVSPAVQEYARRVLRLPADKLTVISNGIDVDRHAAHRAAPPRVSRRDLGLAPDDFVFLHVAGIDARKGHNAILAAMVELARTDPVVRVLSVGAVMDESYLRRMSDRIRRWGLEAHFRFMGFTPDIHDFYRLADAFVLPSLIEGSSLALLEAAVYDLPIIATRVGAAADLLEGEAFGLLIDPPYRDIGMLGGAAMTRLALEERPPHTDELVQAMREFVRHREHWRSQGARGHDKIAAAYDIGATARRYEAVFQETVEAARAGAGRRERGTAERCAVP